MNSPLPTFLLACVVASTAAVVLHDGVRPPATKESAAYLVLTAASYMVDPMLPPALAILYAVICVKAYPAVKRDRESFTIDAPHDLFPDSGPAGAERGALTHAKTREITRDNYKQAIATPQALNAAQNNAVVESLTP